MIAMGGSGGDRLSRVLRHSTMGAGVFNGRVRDGIGFWAHRSGHQTGQAQFFWDFGRAGFGDGGSPICSASMWSCVVSALDPVRIGVYAAMDHERRSSQSGD